MVEGGSVGFSNFRDRFLPAGEAAERVEFAHVFGRGANAALDHVPQAAHRDVIDFAVVGRARSFDEVSPFSQTTPFAESSPILDSIRENIHGIDLQPFLFGEVDAGVRGFARRRLGAERVPGRPRLCQCPPSFKIRISWCGCRRWLT